MISLRLLLSGAALAAGIHYVTKKRPDGTSILEDFKANAPDWMEKAQPYVDRVKGQFDKVAHMKGSSSNSQSYPQKFDKPSPDPNSDYSS